MDILDTLPYRSDLNEEQISDLWKLFKSENPQYYDDIIRESSADTSILKSEYWDFGGKVSGFVRFRFPDKKIFLYEEDVLFDMYKYWTTKIVNSQ